MSHPAASRDEIARVILELAQTRGPQKTICPSEVARAIAGSDETIWRKLMKPVRSVTADLAREGRVAVMRKGKIVDPDAIRGIYRIGILAQGRR